MMTDLARLVLGVDARGMIEGERAIADVGREAENTARKVDRASDAMAADLAAVGTAATGTSKDMRLLSQATTSVSMSAGQMRVSWQSWQTAAGGNAAFAGIGQQAQENARQLKAASNAMSNSADSVAKRNKRDNDEAKRQAREARKEAQEAQKAANQLRVASSQLGQQIGDISQGVALGVSPLTIFAQQGGQVAFALSGMSGVIGTVGRLLSGPWGAALLGATFVLGPFIASLRDTEDAARGAGDVTLSFLNELGIALRPLASQARMAFRTLGDEFGAAVAKMKAALPDISNVVRNTLSLMDRVNARVASFTGGGFATSGLTGQFDIDRARELELRRGLANEAKLNAGPLGSAFVDAVGERNGRRYQEMLSDVALGTGAVADATRAYREAEERLERQVSAGIVTHEQARAELTRRRGAIDAARDATQRATAADREAEQAARSYAAAQRQLAAETAAYFAAVKVPQLGSMTQGEGRDALGKMVDGLGEATQKTRRDTVTIADSFAQMAQRVNNSIQSLANSIKGGDFLGILGGVIDVFSQLGSAGAFGSKIQTGLNSTPSNRSMGGPVYAGNSYIVGENGPERFTPPGTGRIIANDNMATPVRVTVGIDPRNGNITAYVNGQIAQTAPLVAGAGAQQAQAQAAASARRRVR